MGQLTLVSPNLVQIVPTEHILSPIHKSWIHPCFILFYFILFYFILFFYLFIFFLFFLFFLRKQTNNHYRHRYVEKTKQNKI